MRLRGRWLPAVCLLLWAGCSSKPPAGTDAGLATADSGIDSGSPAEADGGLDAGADAGIDAGAGAGIDAGADAGISASADAGLDAGSDAGPLHVVQVADINSPFDAVPNPFDGMVYFTAFDETNGPGVFKAPADGSNGTPVPVCVGDPFSTPFALVLSSDGKTVYVADSSSDNQTDNNGAIFSCRVSGGAPAMVAGSAGMSPMGVIIRQTSGADELLFAGVELTTGMPGVFALPATGGTATVLAEGPPLVDPEAIAALPNGDLLVLDMVGAENGGAAVMQVSNEMTTVLASGFDPGWPGGIAFDAATGKALISAFIPGASGLTLATLDPVTAMFDTRSFSSPNSLIDPGGLHAAYASDTYAIVDGQGGPANGRVYVISH